MPNNLKVRGAIKSGAIWPVWPCVCVGPARVGWDNWFRPRNPSGTIQSDPMLYWGRSEDPSSTIWVQCVESRIDKFRNAANCFIAQPTRPLASPPGLLSMWPALSVGNTYLVYTCTASITCEGFFILHPTSRIPNSPCSYRITKMHMDHCMYGSTEQGNTFWYFMPILVLDLNI